MSRIKRIFSLGFSLLCVALTVGTSRTQALACSTPHDVTEFFNAAPFNGGGWTKQIVPMSSICSSARAVVDGNGVTHVYAMNQINHLIEGIQQVVGGPWTIVDVTNNVGGIRIQGVPNPLLLGGGAIQVFVPGTNGHLLCFFNNNGAYSEFDPSAISGSTAFVVSMASPILFGVTLHVYVADRVGNLHDFYKPPNPIQWTDINLSVQTGVAAVNPAAFPYGGNSIQIAARAALNSDLDLFIQGVNPDGTLNGSQTVVADTTAIAGGTPITSVPAPVVVGALNQNVAIFADDSQTHLVDYFKAPNPTQWVELDHASPSIGGPARTPSVLFFPNVGPNGTVKVYSIVVDGSGFLHLFEYTGDPSTGLLQGGDINFGNTISSDPHAVVSGGIIEVFTSD